MNDETQHGFLLPHEMTVQRLIRQLGGEAFCEEGESADFRLRFYDSFDWRLYAERMHLAHVEAGKLGALRLLSLEDAVLAEAPGVEVTRWPAELPDSELKERVCGILQMRALLPLVTVKGQATELRLLNEDDKTVVRVQFLQFVCSSTEQREKRVLWPRLRLLPVRGYEHELEQLAAGLSEAMEWPPAPDCVFAEAMLAVGREPGDYSSKLNIPLRAEQSSLSAMRVVLRNLLDTIERNMAGTCSDIDSEFLHDLRVATRRTRSALTQIKRVLPEALVEDFKQRFAWLGNITGPTRDLDVFLLELPHYRASLPRLMRDDLDTLEAHLKSAQKREQAKLKRKLRSAEMQQLLADWKAALKADPIPGEPGWFADLPIEQVAAQRIWRMYRRVIRDGRAVQHDSAPEVMHELRKDCKKLRYLIEFFKNAFDDSELKGIVRALKRLLDNLGDYQDKEVQAGKLQAFAQALDHSDPRAERTVMAIGALVADLLRHQEAAHAQFQQTFDEFDSADNRATFKRLFKEKGAHLG